jgi:nucleoid-associated protein YgaU
MNDPAVKLVLAFSILLGGFLAAIALRHDSAVPRLAAPSWSELAALRNRRPSDSASSLLRNRVSAPRQSADNVSAPGRRPTVLAPLDNPPPVPALSAKYPGDGLAGSTGWGMPLLPASDGTPRGKEPQVHKIVDGDTLPALAQRYLGSSRRAIEIFNANRETLNDPELLPIGEVLKIPQ